MTKIILKIKNKHYEFEIQKSEETRYNLFREIYQKHYKSRYTTLNQEAKIPAWKVAFERANHNSFSNLQLKINEIEEDSNQPTELDKIAEKEGKNFTDKELQDLVFDLYLSCFGDIELKELNNE